MQDLMYNTYKELNKILKNHTQHITTDINPSRKDELQPELNLIETCLSLSQVY